MRQSNVRGTHISSSEVKYPWLRNYPKGVDWHAELPEQPLYALLDEAIQRHSDNPFLDFLGDRFTYARAGNIIAQLAGALQAIGVKKGVKVGLLLPNCPHFVFFFFAILKAGGTVVLYNPLLATKEIARQIDDSETELMVTADVRLIYDKISKIVAEKKLRNVIICRLDASLPLPVRFLSALFRNTQYAHIPKDDVHISFQHLLSQPEKFKSVRIEPRQDIAVLLYTGGTTGAPKGVCLSHYNLYANSLQSALGLPSAERGKERVLAVIPFSHAFGLTAVLNTSITLGAELVLLPKFSTPDVLKTIHEKKPTMLLAVPTIFSAIAGHPKSHDYDLRSLKICTCGGDLLPQHVKTKFQKLADCDFVQGYGLTECSPIVTSGSPLGLNKPSSIGVPLPRTEVQIISLDDHRTVLGPNSQGEICVKGPQVMLKYWKRPDATAEALRGDWLHTGDVGYMDDDGYLYLVDRIKDVIITGGYKVFPSVVKSAIEQHPAVEEVAVVGVPHPHWGQIVTAFVVPSMENSPTQDDIIVYLKDRLSSYEMPKRVHFMKALPKSPVGKILKTELIESCGS